MKFSVVIPLYNKERHVQRAINSVLGQTYQEFEIIVINDGSTDYGAEKVKEINDKRIRLITQKNKGVSAARNKGIRESNNDMITFLDADDKWMPCFLETLKGLINNYPEAGIYGLAYEYQQPDGSRRPAKFNTIPDKYWEGYIEDYFEASIKNQLLWTSAVAIPKKVFEDVGCFIEGMTRGEDLEMWLKIVIKYKVAFSNIISAIYYQDADNRACNKEMIYSKSFISRAERFYEDNVDRIKQSLFFEEYMIKIFITKAQALISVGNRKEARALLKKYKYTKYFKKHLIIVFMSSFLPNKINDILYEIRSKITF